MKKILFVTRQMEMGGVEVSLINLLNIIDYSKYDVTLLLEKAQGPLLERIPSQVHISEIKFNSISAYKLVELDEKIDLLHHLYFRGLLSRCRKNKEGYDCPNFYMAMKLSSTDLISDSFDAAIDFHGYGYFTTIFMLNKICAKKYITLIHDEKMDWLSNISSVVDKIDYYFCVSNSCAKKLLERIPHIRNKIAIFPNVIDTNYILQMSKKPQTEIPDGETNVMVSVGRLEWQKGFDIAVEAARILKQNNVTFSWYIIGEGSYKEQLSHKITEYNLQNNVFLLGLKDNPYPYMRRADYYIQTSRHEGYGIAICEARVLQKQIISTDIPCVREQCTKEDCIVFCKLNADSIANTIQSVLNNSSHNNTSQMNRDLSFEFNNKQLEIIDKML